ncbi:transposase [Streptomyces sp. NBC_00046]|uniref:transposase n=1 Tax=unclassified Streptomyces TaxID=2593676 RepID=UPI0032479C5D
MGVLAGLRLMAVDGTCVDIADTPANDEAFGRHGGRPKPGKRPYKRAAFPQARIVGLVECGTRVIVDAAITEYSTHETTAAKDLARSMRPGMLVLADRGYPGVGLWRVWSASGAQLLMRLAIKRYSLAPDQLLPDGSWLTTLYGYTDRRHEHGIQVRAVAVHQLEYRRTLFGRQGRRLHLRGTCSAWWWGPEPTVMRGAGAAGQPTGGRDAQLNLDAGERLVHDRAGGRLQSALSEIISKSAEAFPITSSAALFRARSLCNRSTCCRSFSFSTSAADFFARAGLVRRSTRFSRAPASRAARHSLTCEW